MTSPLKHGAVVETCQCDVWHDAGTPRWRWWIPMWARRKLPCCWWTPQDGVGFFLGLGLSLAKRPLLFVLPVTVQKWITFCHHIICIQHYIYNIHTTNHMTVQWLCMILKYIEYGFFNHIPFLRYCVISIFYLLEDDYVYIYISLSYQHFGRHWFHWMDRYMFST